MTRVNEQLALTVHGAFSELDPDSPLCQRWYRRLDSWVSRSDGGFDPSRYEVERIADDDTAKVYVQTHHYSGSYPAATHRFGLYLRTGEGEGGRDLVGVAVYGIPMQVGVLTKPLPDLVPYRESLVLARFVLEGDRQVPGRPGGRAPANSESWFLARTLRSLAGEDGVRAVVAFSDPVARVIGDRVLFPGHHGIIYQASNAVYAGRSTGRTLIVLPDGTSLPDRALAKVRAQDRGHEYVERQLIALGARPWIGGAGNAAVWLRDALEDVGAVRLRHRGCHRYILFTSPANRRTVRIQSLAEPYPKGALPA
jgi:hypothetical protein